MVDAAEAHIARLDAQHEERMREKKERRDKALEFLDPTENANVFWQDFNRGKAEVMAMLDANERTVALSGEEAKDEDEKDKAKSLTEARTRAGEVLRQASDRVGTLQAMVARASLFLPGYDQRLGNNAVMMLHQAVAESRGRIFPREAFKFKTRRCPPADMTQLMALLRRDVGTTSSEEHLQGDTQSADLDPALCFADRENEVLIKHPGDIGGRDFVLTRMKNCTVFLMDTCGAVRADRLEGCKVYVGPVRSVLMEKLDHCTLTIAAQQLRIHSAKSCDFYVRMRSGPIIEHSNNLRFAPYNLAYPELDQQLAISNLKLDSGMWAKVEDFNWLRSQQSPNWSIMSEQERVPLVTAPGNSAAAVIGDGDEM